MRDPKVASGSFVTQSGWFSSMETPDKYTVIATFDAARPAVFDFFQLLNMVDPVTMQGPDAAMKSVGTGPFVLVEWSQGDRITFTKNKNYWQSGRPFLDGIETPIVKDPAAMIAQLEGGAVDVADAPLIRDFNRLKTDPKFQGLVNQQDGQHFILAPNTTVAPFDNKLVRQALRFAIDRQRMNDVALLGVGVAKSLPWLPGSTAYDEAKSTANGFDLDKAAALLKQAGVSGFEMDLLPLVIFPEIDTYVQIYQADLAKIGITANILHLDFATWLDQVNNAKYHGMYASSDGRAQLTPVTYLTASAAANPYKNNEGFKSDALVALIDQLGAVRDAAGQKAVLDQINDLYLDESYTNVVASFPSKLLAKASVRGIDFPLYAAFGVTNAWLDTRRRRDVVSSIDVVFRRRDHLGLQRAEAAALRAASSAAARGKHGRRKGRNYRVRPGPDVRIVAARAGGARTAQSNLSRDPPCASSAVCRGARDDHVGTGRSFRGTDRDPDDWCGWDGLRDGSTRDRWRCDVH